MNQRMVAMALAGLSLLGTHPLWAADKVELTTRVSGVVESVLVKPGQHVKKGAVLLRLDRTILQARLEEATADHARAQADEADAKREQGGRRNCTTGRCRRPANWKPPNCATRVPRPHCRLLRHAG